jgi:hypothetical protein
MAVASAAVNSFQTVVQVVQTSAVEVYNAPIGYTGVVLLAQCTNIGSTTHTMTLNFKRDGVETPLIKDIPIPANDTVSLLAGKLVLETGDILVTQGSSGTDLRFLTSVLETSNL